MALTQKQKTKAYNYYLMGLNSKEIALLVDSDFRAVQHLAQSENWNQSEQKDNRKTKALELYQSGQNYKAIAERLRVGRTTVYNWIKETREFKAKQKVK